MAIEQWLRTVERRALCNPGVVSTTYWMARRVIDLGIPGDFVECGVFAGAQCAAMARACMDSGVSRIIHLFDSFAGIPHRGPNDGEVAGIVETDGALVSSGVSSCTVSEVTNHMQEWEIDFDLLKYHVGWFQDTVPEADIKQIALLRLDGDLYASTKVCMEHLYPRLSTGGWCIVDDWNLEGCRKAVNEYFSPCLAVAPLYWQKH